MRNGPTALAYRSRTTSGKFAAFTGDVTALTAVSVPVKLTVSHVPVAGFVWDRIATPLLEKSATNAPAQVPSGPAPRWHSGAWNGTGSGPVFTHGVPVQLEVSKKNVEPSGNAKRIAPFPLSIVQTIPSRKKLTVPPAPSNPTSGPITLAGAPPEGESVTTRAGPASPAGPVGPVGPCGPVAPVGPVGPGGPTSPFGPSVHAERTTRARRAVRRARVEAMVAQWAMVRPTSILLAWTDASPKGLVPSATKPCDDTDSAPAKLSDAAAR